MADNAEPQRQEDQTIEQLTERYQALNKQHIEAQTNLRHATKQLEDLQKQARQKYGTDDLSELRQKLDEMRRENEKRRSEYQQALDQIEADLTEVRRRYQAGGNERDEAEAKDRQDEA